MPSGVCVVSVTGWPGVKTLLSAVQTVLRSGAAAPWAVQPNCVIYAPGAPSGESSRTGGEFFSIVCRCVTSSKSSICAPLRLIEPASDGVRMLTRGLDARAAETDCSAFAVEGAEGCACGCGSGCCFPASTLVVGGLDGKYLFAAQVQPSRTSALSTTARIRFLLSFTWLRSSWYRVVTLAAPRMAAANAFEGHPSAPRGPIAFNGGDRIGRTAGLIPAARRKHPRRAQLPAARDQNHEPRDH